MLSPSSPSPPPQPALERKGKSNKDPGRREQNKPASLGGGGSQWLGAGAMVLWCVPTANLYKAHFPYNPHNHFFTIYPESS